MRLRTILKKQKQSILSFIGLGVTLSILYLFTLSSVNLYIGNIFFGGKDGLYNINLASFFYTHAAYPISNNTVEYAHYQLGRTYFIQGRLQAARNEIYKELELFPENKRSYYMLGLIYGYMHEEKLAIEAFGKFIEWKPESWAARNDKAWLEFRIGDIDAALETISPVTHLTDNAWVQNTYGVLLMNKGRYLAAKLAFANAKAAADKLTETEWGKVYPGNDPRIYTAGINATRKSIESNIELIRLK
jgi:tetratricopeptide (TPR) repeat protein